MVSREKIWRMGIYLSGMMLLALGITLTTLSGQGASAIVSVPYTISRGTGLKFADLTLLFYCSFVAVQLVIKGKNRSWADISCGKSCNPLQTGASVEMESLSSKMR